uniref:Uncharacterized protein n=1 Tax=Trichobilharzia regenti TaxID=157069 RepID=A0AA85KP57_TRIRE|nr:unnamed protein product [Trichobilharzia regenti]
MKDKQSKLVTDSVPKKTLFMNLEFKGDQASDMLKNRLSKSVSKTFLAAKLHMTFTSHKLFSISVKDKLHCMTASMCIYQFTYSRGARYIGRSQRTLPTRIRGHIPAAWFYKGERKCVRSSILEHLINFCQP